MSKKSTRQAYGEALVELGKINKDVVVLDADLTKSTKTNLFQEKFPERHFNVGIAEADLIGTAAGLAACGKIAFASTFAMFAAGRGFEQIRNTVAYPKLNVKIAPTHAGISDRRRWRFSPISRGYSINESYTRNGSIISSRCSRN